MRKLALIPALLIGALVSPVLSAAALLDIYQQALLSDPTLKEAFANLQATSESRPQARSQLLPQIRATGNFQNVQSDGTRVTPVAGTDLNQPFDSDQDRYGWTIELQQTIFQWDRFVSLDKANKEVAQAELDYRAAEQDLMFRVAEAYFNVLAAQDTLESEQAAKEAIGRQLEQANRRFEVGLVAITDVQEAQAGYDESVAAEIVAKRNVATSKEILREITGEYPTELLKPGQNMPLVIPSPPDENEWVQTSLAQNLSLLSSQLGADITRDEIDVQRSGHLPTLDFSARTGTNWADGVNSGLSFDPTSQGLAPFESDINTKDDTTLFQLSLTVPIFNGGGVSSQVQAAVYRHRASRENYERTARQTEREARDAYLGVESEIARVNALKQAKKSSGTALEATEAGFEVGTRTTVDVLDARRQVFLTQTNYARSRYDYILNVLKLKQAAGTLTPNDIQEVNSWLIAEPSANVN